MSSIIYSEVYISSIDKVDDILELIFDIFRSVEWGEVEDFVMVDVLKKFNKVQIRKVVANKK